MKAYSKLHRFSLSLLILFTILISPFPKTAAASSTWYVAPGGDDASTCTSPATACETINAAIAKASAGDTIYIAAGTYAGTDSAVVSLDKDLHLSAGWDASFTTQAGFSTLDGQDARRGLEVTQVTASIERLVITNGKAELGGGIENNGTLTVTLSVIRDNAATMNYGGGILNYGSLTLQRSLVSENRARYAGGITNYGLLVVNNSTLTRNQGSAIINNGGEETQVFLNNSTITANLGHGIQSQSAQLKFTVQNTILAGNSDADCYVGPLISAGYNILGSLDFCLYTAGPGDQTNQAPQLGVMVGIPGYFPLPPGSPAINTGNPAGCKDHLGNALLIDQRGVPRQAACDIGAYEYTMPGPAALLYASSGTPQNSPPGSIYHVPFQVDVLDSLGSPVGGADVNFTAPLSGPSGFFADTQSITTTATSDTNGIAAAAAFFANELTGSYTVTASLPGLPASASFSLSNSGWYVSPTGDDGNVCTSPLTPCRTIRAALEKPGFKEGDTVLVAAGVYTGWPSPVVLILKDAILSGGWDSAFTAQEGFSIIDGSNPLGSGSRMWQGVTVAENTQAIVERFIIQYSQSVDGGGIHNSGRLTLSQCSLRNNFATYNGSGIYNQGTLVIQDSSITNNQGTGIYQTGGVLVLHNTTISGNTEVGIAVARGKVFLNNTTISQNPTGITFPYLPETVTLKNSLLANNQVADCSGTIYSEGHNLVGSTSSCTLTPAEGDLTDVNPALGPLEGTVAYHPLLHGSPAINAGDPTGCTDHFGVPILADQRGRPRSGRCDIGAYEVMPLKFSRKNVFPEKAKPGELLAYTITLTNIETVATTNVVVTDTLPVELKYIPDTLTASSGIYSYADGVISWSGQVPEEHEVTIEYSATVDSAVPYGISIMNPALILHGQDAFIRIAHLEIPLAKTYLPLCNRNFCPEFMDDFSYTNSGWTISDNEYFRREYLNGEYRILSKQSGNVYMSPAPTCTRENYSIEVDARWQGEPGFSYGVFFGFTSLQKPLYVFEVNTDSQEFMLSQVNNDIWTVLIDATPHQEIHGGSAVNHLKVVRSGSLIQVYANGALLGSVQDTTVTGLTGSGLLANPYDDVPAADARFDNYKVVVITP